MLLFVRTKGATMMIQPITVGGPREGLLSANTRLGSRSKGARIVMCGWRPRPTLRRSTMTSIGNLIVMGSQAGLDYLFFDMAVNSGPHEAALILQRALGVTADGRIGPVTRQAAAEADPAQLIAKYTAQKRAFYLNLHQPRFLRGWLNRCVDVQANALTMIGA